MKINGSQILVEVLVEQGADVINLSLGGPKTSSTVLDEAIESAVAKGVTVVVSAGNESSDAKYYCPSHLGTERGVICVGAVDSSDKQAYFSNYGNSVDIKAPGVNIKAYVPGESDIRRGAAAVTGRFCVIGSKLTEQALKELFNIE